MEHAQEEYAKLLIRVGVNLQPGQTLVLDCPVDCAPFARLAVQEAYAAGARDVVMNWSDDALTRMRFLQADTAVFDEVPDWVAALNEQYSNPGCARLFIISEDPENLLGVDADRIKRSIQSRQTKLKKYGDMRMNNEYAWCIGAVPTPAWAQKVFPGVPVQEAMDKLWNAILYTVRVNGDGTSAEAWQAHEQRQQSRMKWLNEKRFAKLIYTNALGTSLTIELPPRHQWTGGGEDTKGGIHFVANMPTEEIFTLPMRNGVNGVVYASMPLVRNGTLITDIRMVVKDGKIIEEYASNGLDVLRGQLDADEGARYFGEVALVPYHSPISDQNILYYETLFDENASCHLAFGQAYPTFTDGAHMTREEKLANGANDSIVHVDFMIGTADLSIMGVTAGGQEIPVFVDGDFTF